MKKKKTKEMWTKVAKGATKVLITVAKHPSLIDPSGCSGDAGGGAGFDCGGLGF